MNDNTEEQDPARPAAVGMAKRAFWMGATAAAISYAGDPTVLGRAGAILMMGAIALCWIGGLIGIIAVIRITADEFMAIFFPGLAGVALCILAFLNLTHTTRDNYARAKQEMRERQGLPQEQPSPPTARIPAPSPQPSAIPSKALPKPVITFQLPYFDAIPAEVQKITAKASAAKGEEAGALRAWAAQLSGIHVLYTNTIAASNALHQIDILDPKLATDTSSKEHMRRKGLANDYSSAWHKLAEGFWFFAQNFGAEMRKEHVAQARGTAEMHALGAVFKAPDTARRLELINEVCKAEEGLGLQYNYSVSPVLQYVEMAARLPAGAQSYAAKMEERLSQIKEAEKTADAAHQKLLEAFGLK